MRWKPEKDGEVMRWWFAILPVGLESGEVAWLEWVRYTTHHCGGGDNGPFWLYYAPEQR